MKSHSVIFIGQSDYQRFDRAKDEFSLKRSLCNSIFKLKELPKRIYSSFLPPILGDKSRKVYVDLVGPILALILLAFILNYGHAYKHPMAVLSTSPLLSLLLYSCIMPSFCFLLAKLGKSELGPLEIISLLGYGLYGHIFTIISCYIIDKESSNYLFFILMIIFGGLSGFRIVMIMLLTIPKPAARLVVCSFVIIVHLLFLVFIHFAYMHRTFKYGTGIHMS